MKRPSRSLLLPSAFLILLALAGLAPAAPFGQLPAGVQSETYQVDGITREALIYAPTTATTTLTPVVFVFHGHGGTERNALNSFKMNENWPAAISVYMQGLPTPGQLTDPTGLRAGWQAKAGDEGDRDLKFFDAVLLKLQQDYKVDAQRIYATGHSNGGGFTYLLWSTRSSVLAAVAPSSAAAGFARSLTPKPAMICGGESDPLVKFAWQQMTMNAVRKIDGCAATGQPWAPQCTLYPSATGTPVVTLIFPGGHRLLPTTPPLIAKFFQESPNLTAP